jgi:hypothetical protein
MNFSFQLKEFLILALLCCALFVGACWVQSSYLSYFDYMPWASLFFLPAGVKLIAFIVARGAGFWGVSAGTSLTLHLDKSWNPPEIHDYVTSFEFFCLFPFLGILLIQKLLKIKADLVGMTELQVILLVVLGALVNGVSINIYMFIEGMISMQDVGVGILATMFGYVTGIAFLMFVISLGTGIKRSVLKG